jgi:3-oxoadipate enol-lactonase
MPHATLPGGRRLFYRFDGPEDAPVVLFSNSLGTDHAMWDGLVPTLTSRFRVLRYDTRGHGRSDAPAGEYRMDDLADDVLALLDEAGVEQVRFCGLSMGGAIGQRLAAVAPERVVQLVLANTGATFGGSEVWRSRIDTVRAGGMVAVVDGVIERWFTPGFVARAPEAVAPVRAMLLETPADGYVGCCAALRDTDYRPLAPAISAPTLVIGGAHDQATPPECSEELASGVRGARLVMLDAAHLSVIEQPAAFAAALAGFLE